MRLKTAANEPEFDRDGAALFSGALTEAELTRIENACTDLTVERAGVRLFGRLGLVEALAPVGRIARVLLDTDARPVRAVLFDKTAATNWALPWHQDRTIAVRRRLDVEGFGPWTRKAGVPHVAPPSAVLAGMITLRVHLDPVPRGNAPLLVAPGSHRLGRIAEPDIAGVVARSGVLACLAERGDVWACSTPVLHASEAAEAPGRRRVLQVDYAARPLPGGLEWLGV